ncbi:phage tail tube protein [Nocardiopsis sp. HUAS JQ3]|uniref:phage tail tube protein n=1 Tax=Nocardiopsis sp. HUAS JQ3 TaxID=3061629 RepID=UPI0023A9CDC1|nr:hypothetical protein [Nocardiopsis sp. HUAS JQ3]WDZ91143.1 hypothetical protein PV789_00775 [Nocardiopsis sp. HUAS JQ3]
MPKVAARGWVFELSDGEEVPTWLQVEGITEWESDPSEGEEETEITDFNSDGESETLPAQRGEAITLTGLREMTSGEQAPGQARVEALARLKMYEGVGAFRWRHSTETSWRLWDAWVSLGSRGGGNNDMTSFECSIRRVGAEQVGTVTP